MSLRKFVVKDADGNVIRRAETSYRGDLSIFVGTDGASVEEVTELPDAPPPPDRDVTPEEVNNYARRLLAETDWYVLRAQDPGGEPVPEEIWEYRAAVRLRAGEIGMMDPIPSNYQDASFWPDRL